MNIPTIDHSLVARSESAATGATIHELNGILGCYRDAHRRINSILADPKLAELLADNVKQANEAEARLRAFLGRAYAAKVV